MKTYETKQISSFLSASYFKEHFKLMLPQNLFGYDWQLLQQNRCPICACKLYEMMRRPGSLYCRGTKHKRLFVIHKEKVAEIVTKLSPAK